MKTHTQKTREEVQAIRDTAADADDILAYWAFRDEVFRFLSNFGRCDSGRDFTADFFLQDRVDDFDLSKVLIVVSMKGRAIGHSLLLSLSDFIRGLAGAFPVFFDAQLEHGKPFEIVVFPNGDVWGSEAQGTNYLNSIGFTR